MTKDLRVLTTSRAPLGLSSESVYLLPELSLPTAVELFGQRARAARPGVDLPADAVEELLPPPGRAAAGGRAGRGAGPGDVGRRDRPAAGRPVRPAARRRARRAGAAPHPARGGRLELEPARRRPARRRCGRCRCSPPGSPRTPRGGCSATTTPRRRPGPGAPGRPVPAPGGRHPHGTRFRMLETVREFSTAHAGGGRRDRSGGRPVPGLGTRLRRGAPRRGLRSDPFVAVAADPGRAGQPRAGAPAAALAGGRRHRRGDVAPSSAPCGPWSPTTSRLTALIAETARLLSHFRPAPDLVEATRTALSTRHLVHVRAPGSPPDALDGRAAPAAAAPPDHPVPGRRGRDRRRLRRSLGPARGSLRQRRAAGGRPPPTSSSSYFWEDERDLERGHEGRPAGARRLREPRPPAIRALAAARPDHRTGLHVELGDEARATCSPRCRCSNCSARSDPDDIRAWTVLANLQVGAVDEAEHWLEQTAPSRRTSRSARSPTASGARRDPAVMVMLPSSRRCGPWWPDLAEDARRRVQRGFTAASVGRSRGRGIQSRPAPGGAWLPGHGAREVQ